MMNIRLNTNVLLRKLFKLAPLHITKLLKNDINLKVRMRFFSMFRNVIHRADFFSTTQLIRYQEDPAYKTLTGGLFSIAIIILLSVICASMSLSAVRREKIEWAHQIMKDSVPPKLDLPFHTFNIGVQLAGLNLSATVKYFDVVMTQKIFKNKMFIANNEVPMTVCRRSDWNLTSNILGNFDRMNATNWLCPDTKSQFFIQGKWTSDDFSFLEIQVLGCGTFHPNETCANQSQIDAKLAQQIYFSVYYVNALVSPSQKTAVSYYMSDTDYISFGSKLGSANEIFISDFEVETDHSILPYTDIRAEKGGFVMLPTTISTQQVGNGWFSRFSFRKATNKHVFVRSFAKFDTVVSYIGGLFGSIIGLLFLMNHYTRTNFQISIGSMIYLDDLEDKKEQNMDGVSLNFCYYLGFWAFNVLKLIGREPDWPMFAKMNRFRGQAKKHLDIKLMIDKMNFLERSLKSLCGDDKYKALHLREQISLSEAKKLRQYYYIRPIMIAEVLKKKKQQNNRLKLKQSQLQNPADQDSVKQSPNFLRGPARVLPKFAELTPSKQKQKEEIQENMSEAIVRNDSQNTMNFTKKTRWHIDKKKSMFLENEHLDPEEFNIGEADVVESLDTIWKMASNGDQFCQHLWNNIDQDVKVILQKKFEQNIRDFVIEKSVCDYPSENKND